MLNLYSKLENLFKKLVSLSGKKGMHCDFDTALLIKLFK